MILDSFCSYACGGVAWWMVPAAYILGAGFGMSGTVLWMTRNQTWK